MHGRTDLQSEARLANTSCANEGDKPTSCNPQPNFVAFFFPADKICKVKGQIVRWLLFFELWNCPFFRSCPEYPFANLLIQIPRLRLGIQIEFLASQFFQ